MSKKIFITGGAGFIGSNVAKYYVDKGYVVTVYDNLSRKGVEKNLKWLRSIFKKKNLKFVNGDIRDFVKVCKYIKGSSIIFHEAAQVAVTTSLIDPFTDFEINARGTLNLLEATRIYASKAVFVYSSTNKVYGNLDDIPCKEKKTRYVFKNIKFKHGVSEKNNLDFHSPYGCSKGVGDQYVRDYSRVYGLKTIVFRQSCIYGDRQFGNEDQGWVMHFVKKMMEGNTVNIYGDGKQVRDILNVTDLVNAYDLAIKKISKSKGQIYNIGGGYKNTISVIELVRLLEDKLNKSVKVKYSKWREGDQKIFVSDNRKIEKTLGWKSQTSVDEGINKLIVWAKNVI